MLPKTASEVLAKLVPDDIHPYLAGFIPGLFFEISVLLANPERVRAIVGTLESMPFLENWGLLAVALALAYLIGTWFVVWVSFFQWGFRSWQSKFFNNQQIPDEVIECWGRAASTLLEKRYGISVKGVIPAKQWSMWYNALWTPSAQLVRGDMVGMALHATGWAGLTALIFAPGLRNPSYISFSLFFVIFGLWSDYYLAKRLMDPQQSGIVRLRAVLAELKQAENSAPPKGPPADGNPPAVNQPQGPANV